MIKKLAYYAVVLAVGAFLLYNLYNSKALFTVKADIESYTYKIQQLLDK